MNTILTYGSLRKDEYNFNSFVKCYGENNIKYIRTITIQGYELYSLGSYPGIKESTNDKTIIVDILEVSNEVYKHITNMELGANYSVKKVELDGSNATIYVYEGDVSNERLVISGDWSKYLQHKKELV